MTNEDLYELYYEILNVREEHKASLLKNWRFYTGCDFPRIKNKKGKEVEFLKYYKTSSIVQTKTNTLDDLIASKTNETKLITNVLYDKSYTDIPDPYRKRRKNGF